MCLYLVRLRFFPLLAPFHPMKFIPFLTPLVAALKLILQLDSLVSMDTFMVKHPLPFERHAWGNFQALSGEATLANLREFYRESTVSVPVTNPVPLTIVSLHRLLALPLTER